MILCPECKKPYCKLAGLKSHVKKHHPGKLDILTPYTGKKLKSSTSICGECNQTIKHSSLRYHMKSKHSDKSANLISSIKKEKTYLCETCGKEFTILNRFINHKNTHKNNRVFKELKCNLCYQYSHRSKENLLIHFKEFHGIKIENEIQKFSSFEKFSWWKRKLEEETSASFVKMHGSHKTKLFTKIKYSCHRSGEFRRRGKNQRRLKGHGSNKIDAFCPASINVVITQDGLCEAQILKTHVGHDTEINHLFLNQFQRQELANKIAANVPFKKILEELHESKLERLRLLKKKDLHNIKQGIRLNCHSSNCTDQSEVDRDLENVKNEGDQDNDDHNDNSYINTDTKIEISSQQKSITETVQPEKTVNNQTLIDAKVKIMEDFVHIMNSICSLDELTIVKNNISQISPALHNLKIGTSEQNFLSKIQNHEETLQESLLNTKKALVKNNFNEFSVPNNIKLHTRFEFYLSN